MEMNNDNDFLTDNDNSAINDLSNFDLTSETSDISEVKPDNKKKMMKLVGFVVLLLALLIGAWSFLFKSSSVPDMNSVQTKIPKMEVSKKMDQVAETINQAGTADVGSSDQVIVRKGFLPGVGSAKLLNREVVDQEMGPSGEDFISAFSMVDTSGDGSMLLSGIDNGSLMDQFGFQNGDVISAVNNNKLNGGVATLVEQLQSSDEIKVKVIRNGKPWKIFLKYK